MGNTCSSQCTQSITAEFSDVIKPEIERLIHDIVIKELKSLEQSIKDHIESNSVIKVSGVDV